MTSKPNINDVTLAPPATRLTTQLVWGVLLMLLAWSWQGADMRPMALMQDSANMVVFSQEFFPPNFHDWRIYLHEMVITIHIAIWGTVLAVVCAVPFGLLCAENIVPPWIYQPMRRLMDACRAINEMVFAMLFIVAVGLGPFAGVLALWIHTNGVLAKLFAEAVEAIDPRPVEGVKATGANALEEILYGVIPQGYPFGFRIHSTALNQMCALHQWWVWWELAVLVWCCTSPFEDLTTPRPLPFF